MSSNATSARWLDLLGAGRKLYATNTLLATTIAPSAIRELGGIAYITWLTTAYLDGECRPGRSCNCCRRSSARASVWVPAGPSSRSS